MKTLRIFSRILVGIVFMFSGFVKAVDPLGSMYKFQDYFTAFHMDWAHPLALYLGIVLAMAEFIIGVGLLFGTRMRLSAYAVTIFMTFFTILTLILAIYNPVSDCGCFGDAIKMTNWQTFYKNLFLMVFTLIIFAQRNRYREPYHIIGQGLILGLGMLFILGTSIYSYRYLPILDFLPWKVGNKIADYVLPTPQESEIYLIYQNTETGEKVEYTASTLPWQDSVLMSKLVFLDQRQVITKEYKEAPIHDFEIFDEEHNTITEDIINNPDFQFMLIVYDVNKTARHAFPRINEIAQLAEEKGISFVALTGSIYEKADNFRHDVGALYYWYTVDETALKSIIRSNPGLVLLRDGVVVAKWPYRDIPSRELMQEKFLDKKD